MSRNVAFFRISAQLLMDTLSLPEGTEIIDVAFDRAEYGIAVTVSNPSLKEVLRGEPVPECVPIFRRQRPIEFERWEQK